MKLQLKLLAILNLALLTTCKNECQVVKETYESGQNRVVEDYPNCSDTTTYKRRTFYKNGQISSEGFIVKNVKNGNFKSWTDEGILTAQWEVIDGKEHGFTQCWYDNGVKKREVILNKGIRDGIYKDWDEDTQPIAAGNYKNGQMTGKWTYWEKDGSRKVRTYKNDTLWGSTYEYLVDSLEIIQVVGQYERGVETGLWKWFDKDSILYQTAILTNGEYTG